MWALGWLPWQNPARAGLSSHRDTFKTQGLIRRVMRPDKTDSYQTIAPKHILTKAGLYACHASQARARRGKDNGDGSIEWPILLVIGEGPNVNVSRWRDTTSFSLAFEYFVLLEA